MPKKGISRNNQKHSLTKNTDREIVFNYLNKLKPNGATKKEICKKTGLSESKVRRQLDILQDEPQPYGNKSYKVKREGYIYKVEVYDQDGSVINYEKFTRNASKAYENLKKDIVDTNALTAKKATPVNDAVILYPMKKRPRKQIKALITESFGSDIKDILPVDDGLYLILSTDDENRFKQTKRILYELYKECAEV